MAWDKQLLSRAQHLTLLISGLRGVYPFVQHDATYTQTAHFHGTAPQFRVGLTSGYKPTREDATEMIRKYGLKEEYDAQPVPDAQPPLFGDDYLDYEEQEISHADEEPEPEPEEPETGFRPFSLTSSLESLLNSHFLHILQLRIRYKLGWAGAEALLWEIETSQQAEGDIMRLRGDVCLSQRHAQSIRSSTSAAHTPCRPCRRPACSELRATSRPVTSPRPV